MPDVLDTLIADATDRQDDLTLFPLAADAPAQKPDSLRKFLNVDLETVLPQIMKQKTAFYQTDLNYALDAMREGAASGDPAKQNFPGGRLRLQSACPAHPASAHSPPNAR